jgi:prepilin-type processing-associated H-X9-DG protein
VLLPFIEQDNLFKQWDPARTYYQQSAAVRTAGVKTFFCPARRSPPQLSLALDVSGGVLFPGSLSDYAGSAGDRTSYAGDLDSATANGAMILAHSTVSGGRLVSWFGRLNFASLRDGTTNTLLMGEKHVLKGSEGNGFADLGGDSSVYNGDLHRNLGRCGGPNFEIASSPTDSRDWARRFGSAHSGGVCQFVFGDGSVRSLSPSIASTTLRLLVVRDDGLTIPNF